MLDTSETLKYNLHEMQRELQGGRIPRKNFILPDLQEEMHFVWRAEKMQEPHI